MQKNSNQSLTETDIYYLTVQDDEELAPIRDAFEDDLKSAGVSWLGMKGTSELMYQIGRALSGRHPGVQRWLDGRKVRR